MFLVPEPKARDTKHPLVIIYIQYFNKEHILMAQREAEGIYRIEILTFYPVKESKSIE